VDQLAGAGGGADGEADDWRNPFMLICSHGDDWGVPCDFLNKLLLLFVFDGGETGTPSNGSMLGSVECIWSSDMLIMNIESENGSCDLHFFPRLHFLATDTIIIEVRMVIPRRDAKIIPSVESNFHRFIIIGPLRSPVVLRSVNTMPKKTAAIKSEIRKIGTNMILVVGFNIHYNVFFLE
jgi:hypothetical protein